MNEHRTAAALGLFDGVHLGHRAVLRAAAAQKANGLIPAAFTFQPDLAAVKGAGGFLYPAALKAALLREECGIESICAPAFSAVAALSGEDFVRDILCGEMHAAYICCGRDFRFGKGAACGVTELRQYAQHCGIAVEVVEDVESDGGKVSSSRIRTLLESGDIAAANTLLGSPYRLRSEIVHGAHLGHTIGFATVNQSFAPGQLVPRFGVYASETYTPEGWKLSVTNIGIKPTVGYTGLPLAETHILNFNGDLYGQVLDVVLTEFLRGEQKFDSLETLRLQLHADIARRRQLSGNYHRPNT